MIIINKKQYISYINLSKIYVFHNFYHKLILVINEKKILRYLPRQFNIIKQIFSYIIILRFITYKSIFA